MHLKTALSVISEKKKCSGHLTLPKRFESEGLVYYCDGYLSFTHTQDMHVINVKQSPLRCMYIKKLRTCKLV